MGATGDGSARWHRLSLQWRRQLCWWWCAFRAFFVPRDKVANQVVVLEADYGDSYAIQVASSFEYALVLVPVAGASATGGSLVVVTSSDMVLCLGLSAGAA